MGKKQFRAFPAIFALISIFAVFFLFGANLNAQTSNTNVTQKDLEAIRKNVSLGEVNSKISNFDFTPDTLTTINFDNFGYGNGGTVPISPDSYPGVSIFAPWTNSLTYISRVSPYSYPNHALVATAPYNGSITFLSPMVIRFNQGKMKDVSLRLVDPLYGCSNTIDVYENGYYKTTLSFPYSGSNPWRYINFNNVSQYITQLVINSNCSDPNNIFVFVDDITFQNNPTQSPIGFLDGIDANRNAYGWSLDPDDPSNSNNVEIYIDGVIAATIPANIASPDVPYPGNHRFSFSIPLQYRDGNHIL